MAKQKSQVEKFREAAREAGTDDSKDAFNKTLQDIARKPPSEQPQQDGHQRGDKSGKS